MAKTAPVVIPIIGDDKFTKKWKRIGKTVAKVGASMQRIGQASMRYVTLPLIVAGAASTKFSLDLNKAMADVATLIPGNLKRVRELKTGVQELSKETGKSTDEIARGLYQTISAFGDNIDTQERLRVAARAGVAGVAETKDAISMLSIITRGYGDTTAVATKKASDLAFMTVKMGVTTFPELAASMGKTVAFAKSLKVSQEELFTGFATLTDVTGDTAEVATQLRGVMGVMLKPSAKLARVVKKLGYESAMAMMQEEGLVGSLKKLKEAVKGNDSVLAQMVGRKEAITAALALTGAQSDTYTKKLKLMHKAAGATDAAFREQTKGINKAGHAFEIAKRKIIVTMQRIGDVIVPVLTKILSEIEPFLKKIGEASPAMIELGIRIGIVAAAAGPFLVIIGSLLSAIAPLIPLIAGAGGMSGAFAAVGAALTGPVGLAIIGAVAAFATLTAATVFLWDEIEPIRKAFAREIPAAFGLSSDEAESTSSVFADFGKIIKGLTKAFSPIGAVLVTIGVRLSPVVIWFKIMKTLLTPFIWVLKQVFRVFLWAGEIIADFWGPKINDAIKWIGKLYDKVLDFLGPIGELLVYLGKLPKTIDEFTKSLGADETITKKVKVEPLEPLSPYQTQLFGIGGGEMSVPPEIMAELEIASRKTEAKMLVKIEDNRKIAVERIEGEMEIQTDTGVLMEGGI